MYIEVLRTRRMFQFLREISQHYHEIEQHFVVVHGSEDHSIPVEDAMNLYPDLKDSQLIILPDTGHMVQFIRTDDLVKIIGKTAENTPIH